jgi:ribonuclease BN (tRNA processing enzyme)
LQKEDIHIYGRITALADVFDALGSDRVYKKAWDDDRIFKLIKEQRGKHFDPKLVDVFFENLQEILDVREKFQDAYKGKYDTKDKNQIKVLGAYGTKSKGYGTSSFLINKANVIDAGNILEGMDVASVDIENIWISHSHLDHIVDIAYILDNYFSLRRKTLNIYGLPNTIKSIKEHFLNGYIWPDFSNIKLNNSENMALKYIEIDFGIDYNIGENEFIRAFPTDHTIDSCGYIYTKGKNSVLITEDTYSLDSVFSELNSDNKIKSIVVECSFPNKMKKLAVTSKHLTPELLFEELKNLRNREISIYINHIKPSYFKIVSDEIEQNRGEFDVNILKDGEFVNF